MEISSEGATVLLDTSTNLDTSSTGIPITTVLNMPGVYSHGGAILLDTTESMDIPMDVMTVDSSSTALPEVQKGVEPVSINVTVE